MGDLPGHEFHGNQYTASQGAALDRLHEGARAEGADRKIGLSRGDPNARRPGESNDAFVQRQLTAGRAPDARAKAYGEEQAMGARLREGLAAEEATHAARREANVDALNLRNPHEAANGVPKPVYDRNGRVTNLGEMERAARAQGGNPLGPVSPKQRDAAIVEHMAKTGGSYAEAARKFAEPSKVVEHMAKTGKLYNDAAKDVLAEERKAPRVATREERRANLNRMRAETNKAISNWKDPLKAYRVRDRKN